MSVIANSSGNIDSKAGYLRRNDDEHDTTMNPTRSATSHDILREVADETPLRILTVGDGDLSLSLALARAYGHENQIDLTASTLEAGKRELRLAYPNAATDELERLNVPILYGVDATKLHINLTSSKEPTYDVVLFHHPHLGLSLLNEQDEEQHAHRHHVLLSHYLYSATKMMCRGPSVQPCSQHGVNSDVSNNKNNEKVSTSEIPKSVRGLVHVCLCGTQAETWRLYDAAKRQGLKLIRRLPTSAPIHRIWDYNQGEQNKEMDRHRENGTTGGISRESSWQILPAEPGFAAPRRYRNGKLGSRHFLGKYGYRHRRTEGVQYQGKTADTNVSGSTHYIFSTSYDVTNDKQPPVDDNSIATAHSTITINRSDKGTVAEAYTCSICDCQYESQGALNRHLLLPALPEKVVAPTSNPSTALSYTPKGGPENGCLDPPVRPLDEKPEHPRGDQNSDDGVKTFVVSSYHDGKRIRWYLRQCITSLTKRTADSCIKAGRVSINGLTAVDTSRILSKGDVVEVTPSQQKAHIQGQSEETKRQAEFSLTSPTAGEIHIVRRISSQSIIVAWKPAGIRTKGLFVGNSDDDGRKDTMEGFLSKREGTVYSSLSRLDTGCQGLCVLTSSSSTMTTGEEVYRQPATTSTPDICHVITALVHGRVPDSWCSPPFFVSQVPIQRQWKKKKRKREQERPQQGQDSQEQDKSESLPRIENDHDEGEDNSNSDVNMEEMLFQCTERISFPTNTSSTNSSTLLSSSSATTTTTTTAAASIIHTPTTNNTVVSNAATTTTTNKEAALVVELSTITIRCNNYPSANTICCYLRKLGYPVVGDRYCRNEYLSLKRSIRNRIKNKLCLGCYQINLKPTPTILSSSSSLYDKKKNEEEEEKLLLSKNEDTIVMSKDIPKKLSATYWLAHLSGGSGGGEAEEEEAAAAGGG